MQSHFSHLTPLWTFLARLLAGQCVSFLPECAESPLAYLLVWTNVSGVGAALTGV